MKTSLSRRTFLQGATFARLASQLPRAIAAPPRSVFGARSTAEEVTAGLNLAGMTAVVTGCNSGIGYETMRVLALRGAHVIGTARTLEKGRQACNTFGLNDDDRASVDFMLWNAGVDIPVPGFDAGGWSNAKALDCLHEGFKKRDRSRPRFLPEKEALPDSFESPALPGVQVHVLGPPRDADLIEELDPEADGETYRALALRAAAAGMGVNGGSPVPAPFGEPWQVPDEEPGFRLEPGEMERIDDLAQSADAVFAAEKVDGMINSTSLVLVLEIGKARLLLPGDAEWGTWKRILDDEGCRTLLRGSTFFKVGHHGSHNATSKTLVENVLRRKIPAMISTQQGKGNYRNNIPLQDLIDALTGHDIHHVRSDRASAELPEGFAIGEDEKWIDLTLPC